MPEPRETSGKNSSPRWRISKLSIILICLILGVIGSTFFIGPIYWDGAFPPAEFHLIVVDQDSTPINEAAFTVVSKSSGEMAYRVPFTNFTSEGLFSGNDGIIVLYHYPFGFEFGGTSWGLFPLGDSVPQYTIEIKAEGYLPYRFSASKLYDMVDRNKETDQTITRILNGEEITFKVYEYVCKMKSE
jgi:hypothetical protein